MGSVAEEGGRASPVSPIHAATVARSLRRTSPASGSGLMSTIGEGLNGSEQKEAAQRCEPRQWRVWRSAQ